MWQATRPDNTEAARTGQHCSEYVAGHWIGNIARELAGHFGLGNIAREWPMWQATRPLDWTTLLRVAYVAGH